MLMLFLLSRGGVGRARDAVMNEAVPRDASCGAVVKNPPSNVGDAGLIPGSGRSPEEGNVNPL